MNIGSSIKNLIRARLRVLQIEETKIEEIVKFIEEIMDKYWIRMA
jgi:predicted negative regulator of RcsB-dependent stress response